MTQGSQNVSLSVLGAGAWGTVLAWLLGQNGHPVKLWTRREVQAEAINKQRENSAYAPGLSLPPTVHATADLEKALESVQAAVIAIPSGGLRDVLDSMPSVPALISASKGLEVDTFKRFSEVISEYCPDATLAALSGPNLAKEIAAGKPAAATLASTDPTFATTAQTWFNRSSFRVYTSPDLIGVEVAGAMKNVIALAAGMCDGLGLGDNAKATIITRGLTEIIRLGMHLGGDEKTFYGLAGLGDMVATCSSTGSRNHRAGELFVQGATLKDIEELHLTAEGIPTVRAVHDYAQAKRLELPISAEVYRVIYDNKRPAEAIRTLMEREPKPE